MKNKRWLVEGFCPVDEYNCLMPVEYEAVEADGVIQEYQKKRMVCRHVLGEGCSHEADCHFFASAPQRLDKETVWYEGRER